MKSWKQALHAGELGAEEWSDYAREQRGIIGTLADVLAFYMALRKVEASAAKALERVIDALVDFDVRCEAGDVAGAVLELRAFIGRITG